MQVADKWVKRAEKKLFAMRMELNMGGMRAAVDDLNNKNVDEILDMPVGKTFKSASQMLSTDGGNLETLHQDMDAMLLVAPAPGERGLLDADAPTPEELEAEEAATEAAAVAATNAAATNAETWETMAVADVIRLAPGTLGGGA